jgi:hypothetical protein
MIEERRRYHVNCEYDECKQTSEAFPFSAVKDPRGLWQWHTRDSQPEERYLDRPCWRASGGVQCSGH